MINMTVKDVLLATGGELLCGDENTVLNDICIDSRAAKEGDLFVPLLGERTDGHKYLDGAMKSAAATFTSKHDSMESEKPYIKVADTEKALQDVGAYIRNRYSMPVVGVTGSVGKTTTREMITAAIAADRPCFHTEGNFNSQIGVPITLSKMTGDYDAAVIEMGISEPGQMEILSSMVKPDIAVVTVIGVAHMEFLKTQENIRKEKLDITTHLSEGGLLLLNGDDPLLYAVKDETGVRTMTFGLSEGLDFRAVDVETEGNTTVFTAIHGEEKVRVTINALGLHNVRNALAGMAAAYELGIAFAITKDAFAGFSGLRQRIIKEDGRYTVIDDSYNASPDSMKASINVLCDLDCSGKRYAVLGDMFELGENSLSFHRQVGEYILTKNVDVVYVIGDHSAEIKNAIEEADADIAVKYYTDREILAQDLISELTQNDVVLVKGSNGMKLSEVVKILTEK